MSILRGLDVSSCQGVIDWEKVPAEFRFIVEKVSEGEMGLDPTRQRNLEGAHASGRLVAPYHYLRPSQNELKQIDNLWKAIGDTMPDFRVALDLESAPDAMTPIELAEWFLRAADAAESYFGVPPIVYTYPWFFSSRVGAAVGVSSTLGKRVARCPLWMADYSKGETPPEGSRPVVPPCWPDWTLWQTIGDRSSRVPGIAGAVDHDIFNGDEAALRVFRGLPTADQLEPESPILHTFPSFRGDPPDDSA